ncbi:hypothetical protein P692DRAFT_20820256 [Suillus brevipes Sb2]|nr:hypothetical protein P692DRAFT_20820256 [Suillus brevipes Sb2]
MAVEVKIWRMRDESDIPALQEKSDVVSESGVRFRDTVDGRRERHTCSSGKIGRGVILGDDNARRGGRGDAASLVTGRGPPRGCWMVTLGIRTSVNDLVKTYESSKIQESESAIVSPQVMVIWRVVPFSVQQGRCGQGWQVIVIVISALLSLPLLISLLLHPNRLALAIRAHVPKTVHPWVAPLENPASEVASWLWLLLVVVM